MAGIWKKAFVAILMASVAGCANRYEMKPVLTNGGMNPDYIELANANTTSAKYANGVQGTNAALEQMLKASMEKAMQLDPSSPGYRNANKAFMDSGFALVRAKCDDFFQKRDEQQLDLSVTRDFILLGGALTTSVLGLTKASSDAVAGVALGTSAGTAVVDNITKHYLFNAENISIVRNMVMQALYKHEAVINSNYRDLITNVEGDFSFADAFQQITDHQAICTYQNIRHLAQSAIANATLEPSKNSFDQDLGAISSLGDESATALMLSSAAKYLGSGSVTKIQVAALVSLITDPKNPNASKISAMLGDLKDTLWDGAAGKIKLEPSQQQNILRIYQKISAGAQDKLKKLVTDGLEALANEEKAKQLKAKADSTSDKAAAQKILSRIPTVKPNPELSQPVTRLIDELPRKIPSISINVVPKSQ